jgi:histone H3/H4
MSETVLATPASESSAVPLVASSDVEDVKKVKAKKSGKGKSSVTASGPKRNRVRGASALLANCRYYTIAANRRMALKAGLYRTAGDLYPEARSTMNQWLQNMLHKVTLVTKHAKRKTITVEDVVFGLSNVNAVNSVD